MSIFEHEYPYTNFHDFNLDWVIKEIRKMRTELTDFEAVNKVTIGGPWDITKQYPKWVLVENGNDGYISIQPVPAGIDISNTNYWMVLGTYAQVIAYLQEHVADLELVVGDENSGLVKDVNDLIDTVGGPDSGLVKDVNDLIDTVGGPGSGLVKDVEDLQTAIGDENSGIIKDIQDLNDDINDVDDRLTILEESGNDMIIISDSYGLQSVVGANNWVNQFKEKVPHGTVYESLHGSRGFVRNNIVTEGFIDSLQELESTITHHNKIKSIIVCGGANDSTRSDTEIKNAISDFYDYAISEYPNAKIYIGMIAYFTNSTKVIALKDVVLPSYMYINALGGIYLNGSEQGLRLRGLQADGVHPSSAVGNNQISEAVIASFKTGNYRKLQKNFATFTPSGICTAISGLGNVRENIYGDIATIEMFSDSSASEISLSVNKSTWNSDDVYEIGTLSGIDTNVNGVAHGSGQTTWGYMRGGSYVAPINGTNASLKIWLGEDSKVYMRYFGNADASNYFIPINNVSKVEFRDVTIAIGNSFCIE